MRWIPLYFSVFILSCTNSGAHWQPYRISALYEARERGMTVIIHFNENNNEFCEEQKEALSDLVKHERYNNTAAFRVEMGKDKLLEKDLQIQKACTVVVFKGESLVGRSSSAKDTASLKSLIARGL